MTGGQSDPNGFKTPIIVTTEVYDSELESWAFSGAKLPQPMNGVKATNIDGRVLIFGNIFSCEAQLNKCTCALSVCPSVLKLNFSVFGQRMTTYDSL